MGCCISRKSKSKNRKRNRNYKVYSNENTPLTLHDPASQSTDSKTEIILKDESHVTIKLTLNPDDTITYTISRPKRSHEQSSIEIVSREREISITKSPISHESNKTVENADDPQSISSPDTDKNLPPIHQTEPNSQPHKDTVDLSNLQPRPPSHQPSDHRRPHPKFRSQAASSLSSSEPSSSTLSTDPSLPPLFQTDSSSGVLTPVSTSEYDIESPLGPPSPHTDDKHNSRSLPSNLQSKSPEKHTQVHSLPSQDSSGHFSKSTRSLITSTPPLPPLSHRTPITPFPQEGTPLRIPVYENGDRSSYASFPKRIKHPKRFNGRFRCKECLWDWTSSYTWEGWGQKCCRCKSSSSPCFPYRLDTLQDLSQVTTVPHSPTHCLRCQYLKRTMDKSVTCISFAADQRTRIAHV